MKDAIEYLCIVVIACAAGFWLFSHAYGFMIEFLERTAEMIHP